MDVMEKSCQSPKQRQCLPKEKKDQNRYCSCSTLAAHIALPIYIIEKLMNMLTFLTTFLILSDLTEMNVLNELFTKAIFFFVVNVL